MSDVILFSEDALIEEAARKIIATQNAGLNISATMGRRGFSYVQQRIGEIRRSSSALRFLIFLDGDELGGTCPSDAIEQWFAARLPPNIHVRFAFHEVESWLLADRRNIASFLQLPLSEVPAIDDARRDTKELLVQLAQKSRSRALVQDLVPGRGFTAAVGPAYNARLSEFIYGTSELRRIRMTAWLEPVGELPKYRKSHEPRPYPRPSKLR